MLRSRSSHGATRESFSISQVRELCLCSVHTHWAGEHRELRRFYTPSCARYYEKLLAYSTELDAPQPFLEQVSTPHTKYAAVAPDPAGRLPLTAALSFVGVMSWLPGDW